ncbi:MAG: porin family protein [Cytophagales bacterium]|nr:porin family protein [Cytophagales bacterium]
MNYVKNWKRILILCLMIITFQSVMAQEIFLGAKLGGNLMGLKNTDFDEATGITSFGGHGGLFMELRFKGNMAALQADLLYNYDQFEGVLNTFDTKLTYGRLALPVVFKIYPAGNGFNIQVGGQVAYLLHGQSQQTDGVNFDDKFNITNTTTTPDGSLIAGLGFDMDRLTLSARYIFGATDFPNTEELMSGPQVSVGFVAFRGSQLGIGTPKVKSKKFNAPKKKKIGKKKTAKTTRKKR